MNQAHFNFSDPEFVARYVEKGPAAFMPGHSGALQMTAVLLAEKAPQDGRILVVGAGGGLDTRALALARPGWRFTGVDPAGPMLQLARTVLGDELNPRVELIEGGIEAAPEGPFDGACLILVLGLIADDGSKLCALGEIRRRLRPGSTLVLVDRCDDPASAQFDRNIDRYVAYAELSGVDPQTLKNAGASHRGNPGLVTPARNEALLTEAGFREVETFYYAMNWQGWAAQA
jgi:tRNA (cmo5U34)-methyltransferase